jgi:hypothetical protein
MNLIDTFAKTASMVSELERYQHMPTLEAHAEGIACALENARLLKRGAEFDLKEAILAYRALPAEDTQAIAAMEARIGL